MSIIQNKPVIINNVDDKFETIFFLPKNVNLERFGEGGLRKKNLFKISEIKKPLISIITTNLNDDIESTILSVIDQKYENIEFIIKDAGSDDKTLKILEHYNDNIDYWVSEKDNGIWDGTNKGVTLANGDYIVILDSGDLLNREAINNILELIQKNPNADCLLGSCLKERLMHGYRPNDIILHFNIFASNSGAFFLKKDAYKKIGLYDTRYISSADYDLVYKMIVKHKMLGICGAKNNILSIKPAGGFSDNYSFLKTLYDECRIRYNNKQNIFIILFIYFGRCFKKIFSKLVKFDGNKESKFKNDKMTEKQIDKARNYYQIISNKRKYV